MLDLRIKEEVGGIDFHVKSKQTPLGYLLL